LRNYIQQFSLAILAVLSVLLAPSVHAELVINSPVSNWFEVAFGDRVPDYYADQQTGQSDSDIVGTNGVPAFYMAFDGGGTPSLTDGTLGFRVRVSGSSKTYWDNYLWVGFDADMDGDIDLYSSLEKNNAISLHYPGNDLNVSPSTTSIEKPVDLYSVAVAENENYSFMKADDVNSLGLIKDVDNYPDGNKDGTDWFVSFSLNFSSVVTMLAAVDIHIDENTPMHYLVATSTQPNVLNQDVLGPPRIDNSNNMVEWVEFGATSSPLSGNTENVPEPAAMGLTLLGGAYLLVKKRIKSRMVNQSDDASASASSQP
jgi:hypothetical protein